MRLIDADATLEQMKGMNMLFSPKIVIDNMPTISTEQIKADAEAEHKAMCESCIHKVSADDLRAIKYDAVDELSKRCITHIQKAKPLTIEEIIHIIHFNADEMKGSE